MLDWVQLWSKLDWSKLDAAFEQIGRNFSANRAQLWSRLDIFRQALGVQVQGQRCRYALQDL